jgi:hypothetical protein
MLAAEAPGRFEEKARALGGTGPLVDQLCREVYANVETVTRNHPDIRLDRSKRPLRMFAADGATGPAPITAPISAPIADVAAEPPATVAAGIARPPASAPAAAVAAEPPEARTDDAGEHALYEPLIRYLRDGLGVFAKRIDEGRSRNRRGRNGNKWLHPDVVGMEAPARDWSDLVRQCAMELPARKARLVSLEVKVRLTGANIREAFFQAVSNSLWANTAYLVATEVEGDDTLAELRMLCALHGVGYLSLDAETPEESRVLIPARVREEIDWASADRLARENADFQAYLEHVLNYLRTGRVVRGLWE